MKSNQSKNKKGILETMYDTIMEKGGPTGPITQSLVDLWEKPLEPEEENKKTIINKFTKTFVLPIRAAALSSGMKKLCILMQERLFFEQLLISVANANDITTHTDFFMMLFPLYDEDQNSQLDRI